MDLILASASPRRSEILKNNGYDFSIIPSSYEEKLCNKEYSEEIVKNCAYNKAKSVLKTINQDAIIISADTVVVLDNKILGKPKDKNEAYEMLTMLSGRTHFVATAICLINSKTNKIVKDIDKTDVTFRNLSKEEIINYLEISKPYDKAGSYGIQDAGFDFVININGKLDNVIGFPIELFNKMLLAVK